MGFRALLFSLVLLLALPATSFAQDADERQETEERLERIRHLLEEDRERLSEAEEAVQSSQEALSNLNREIALREELVNTYQNRVHELNEEEEQLQESLQELESQIQDLREEYRARANRAYKYGRLHDLALIFSSASINQMLVRVRYLRRFADEREGQLHSIQSTAGEITRQREELEDRRNEALVLLREAEEEQENLARARASRENLVAELRREQSDIQEDIDERQSQAQQLEARLQRMIAREAEREREVQRESPARREEFAALTGSFTENQGRLPWPSDGVVEENFGTVVNPVHGTSTPNPGVLIATSSQAEVRSVFEGRVINVDSMPDLGTTIFVQHGEYITVYGNFSILYVGDNDVIQAGDLLGRAGTEDEPRGVGVFFAIFKDGEAINPSNWLSSQ